MSYRLPDTLGKRRRRAESEPAVATEAAEEGDASSAEEASAGGRRGAARRRMMWTPELHARFMNAVNHLVTPAAPPSEQRCAKGSCWVSRTEQAAERAQPVCGATARLFAM